MTTTHTLAATAHRARRALALLIGGRRLALELENGERCKRALTELETSLIRGPLPR